MLDTTSHSVAQIAAEVGYESEAAFNRAFKREFGDPPARYRNKKREAENWNRADQRKLVSDVKTCQSLSDKTPV
jgi:AraC-like DNA-binding protein